MGKWVESHTRTAFCKLRAIRRASDPAVNRVGMWKPGNWWWAQWASVPVAEPCESAREATAAPCGLWPANPCGGAMWDSRTLASQGARMPDRGWKLYSLWPCLAYAIILTYHLTCGAKSKGQTLHESQFNGVQKSVIELYESQSMYMCGCYK